jgi:hypothetical protein
MADRAHRHTRRRLRMVGAHCRPQARLRKRISRSALSLSSRWPGQEAASQRAVVSSDSLLKRITPTWTAHRSSLRIPSTKFSATIRTDVLNKRSPRSELELPRNPGVAFPSANRCNHQSPFRCMEAGCGNLARRDLRYADDGGGPMTNLVFCHGHGRRGLNATARRSARSSRRARAIGSLRTSPENASNLRLAGGADGIRTSGSVRLATRDTFFPVCRRHS